MALVTLLAGSLEQTRRCRTCCANECVDLLYCEGNLVVGISWRQLQLSDEPVNLIGRLEGRRMWGI
jgi:hypothetical protein